MKKILKKDMKVFVKHMLGTNKSWALKSLIKMFRESQTAEEQNAHTTNVYNDIGFSGVDAEFLSSMAEGYEKYGRLTDNQLPFLFKKMPKYWKQVIAFSDMDKLVAAYRKDAGEDVATLKDAPRDQLVMNLSHESGL